MSELERVLGIQEIDSALDQIPHRSERLPERARHGELTSALASATARRDAAAARISAAESRIGQLEHENADRDAKKARLEKQLKSVIAPREAEALMHEIATLDRERSEADDEELTLLDETEQGEAERAAASADGEQLSAELADATAALEEADAELGREAAELRARRAEAAATVTAAMLARYERDRRNFGGIAISRLTAGRCGACHLDQSRAALEALKSAPDDAEIECEQCGRLLVR